LLTNETSYITKLFFWEGIENYEYTSLFIRLINKFNSFADIGANIGYYSVLAGKLNDKMNIYAFEPSEAPYYFLKENIKLNQLKNVHIYKIALTNFKGEIDFYPGVNIKY